MAKLKAPLLSLGATGQLAKTLVFFPWKGINVVREYVIPAYSDTPLQVVQRDYVKDAVAKIHDAMARETFSLGSVDQVALSALASAKGKIMTWFNQAVKLWVDVKVAEASPIIYSGFTLVDADVTAFHIRIFLNEETSKDLNAGKFYFGTSKTNLIHSYAGELDDGVSMGIDTVDLSAILTAGKKYFVQFRPDGVDPCVGADSGIYYFVAA